MMPSLIRFGRPETVEDPNLAMKFIADANQEYKTVLYRSDPPNKEPGIIVHYERTKYEEDVVAYDDDTKTRLVTATYARENKNELTQILGAYNVFLPAKLRFPKEMGQKPLFTLYGPKGATILITEGEHATAHIDEYDTTATIIQVRDLDILVCIDDVDNKGMPIVNHSKPLVSIRKEHAKYMVGPNAPNCIYEMSNMALRDMEMLEAEKQAMANGQNLLQEFTMSARNNVPGDDGSRGGSSGVASASATNEIARRNVKNKSKTNKKKDKTVKKVKKTVKSGLKSLPSTGSQKMVTSTPRTITTNHRNDHSGAISDESTDLISHAEFTMEDSIIPKLQESLIHMYFSLQYTKDQVVKLWTALAQDLHDNYDDVDESYPGRGNK